ncbi:mechanosensitive ion channel family protein [Paramicrobacterium humi]|nr:mechanosensitive ion channel family protein [Microbacterium humi]
MWQRWLVFGIGLVVGAIVVAVVISALSYSLTLAGRRKPTVELVRARLKPAIRVSIGLIALWIVMAATFPYPDREWRSFVHHVFVIAVIAVVGWLLVGLVYVMEDLSNARYRIDVADNAAARRVRTQMTVVRRLLIVVVVVIAIGAILLTFPGIRAVGASVLASAGIVSIIAGLAAQSVLGNLIAGIQLAFSGALRVDDVVVVEGEWGRIGEITLAYVVVDIWDERRLILPCTYFTTQPFTNWTRRSSLILGTVEFDIDWRVGISAMRDRFNEVLASTDLWDGRSSSLQITDATGGFVRVRAVISAHDSGKLWDLRCLVREELVAWLQKDGRYSLPVTRVQMVDGPDADRRSTRSAPKGADAEAQRDHAGLFSGSPEAEARGSQFTGAVPVQKRTAEEQLDETLEAPADDPDQTAVLPLEDEQAAASRP